MFSFEVDTKITRRTLRGILRSVIDGSVDALNSVAKDVAAYARSHPEFYTPRTGRLQRSIKAIFVSAGGGSLVAQVRATAPYAKAVHDGTKAHAIIAKNADALAFHWAKMGEFCFFKSVWHPGTTPRPFMKTALERGQQLITDKLISMISASISGLKE